MSREGLAWAAGFFDGEGAFSYSPRGGFAAVAIPQTSREPLDRFKEIVGVGTVGGPYTKLSGYAKRPQWRYQVYGTAAAAHVGTSLWPFLGSVKRSQVLSTLRMAERHRSRGRWASVSNFSGVLPAKRFAEWAIERREEMAWAAGFFDGEGCFSYSRKVYTPTIAIAQVDRQVLDRFRAAVGIGKVYGPYRQGDASRPNRRPQFQYRVTDLERVQSIDAMLWFKLGSTKRAQGLAVLQKGRYCRHGHLKRGQKRCGECRKEAWRRWRARNGRPEPDSVSEEAPLYLLYLPAASAT